MDEALSPPQRLPLGIPIKISIIDKNRKRAGDDAPRAPFFFLPSLPTTQKLPHNTKRPLRRREDEAWSLSTVARNMGTNVNGMERISWLARDVRDVSIFGYPPCWCSIAGEIYICLYAIAVQLLEIAMDSAEKEHIPSIDELCSKIPILSEYCRKLDDHVKRRYLEKIAEVGVVRSLFPINSLTLSAFLRSERTDLLSYLVLETIFYTKQQFKTHKSLEAYNFMVSGFITSIQGCIVSGKHVVAGKVRHSQRMNDPLISVWVIAEKDGTVKSAHCLGCEAGLAESCSHVASVLFYIEAWTRIRGKLSGTEVKCTCLLPSFVKDVLMLKCGL